ncbi:MAG: DUF4342 domain-containing protein [Clostridia bacterium]|nr:DUF4342 domain-containing protein [Clostridia bacterium]
MKVDLNKIDQLRERIDLSYEEAVAYLEAAGGDLVRALVTAERDFVASSAADGEKPEAVFEDAGEPAGDGFGAKWIDRVSSLMRKGSSMRLVVERDGTQFASVPVAAGVIGIMWAPELAAVGAFAALASRCSVRIEDPNPGTAPRTGGD